MFKHTLALKEFSVGSWITIGDTTVAEIMANAGFDWLTIDLEHSAISINQVIDLIRVIDAQGVASIIRPPTNDPAIIKRVLDAGASGIIVPMIMNAEDAVNAVAATRFLPRGCRGVGLGRAQGFGAPGHFLKYQEFERGSIIVIAQIEHIDAINELENIASVDGIDGLFIGPYDLSCSLGAPGKFDSDEFKGAIKKFETVSKKIGCPIGFHLVEPDPQELTQLKESGYSFVAYSVDIRMLDVAARQGLTHVR